MSAFQPRCGGRGDVPYRIGQQKEVRSKDVAAPITVPGEPERAAGQFLQDLLQLVGVATPLELKLRVHGAPEPGQLLLQPRHLEPEGAAFLLQPGHLASQLFILSLQLLARFLLLCPVETLRSNRTRTRMENTPNTMTAEIAAMNMLYSVWKMPPLSFSIQIAKREKYCLLQLSFSEKKIREISSSDNLFICYLKLDSVIIVLIPGSLLRNHSEWTIILLVPQRLFFAAQQRIAITWRPKCYQKMRCFITRKNQKEYGPDVK
jgi:hypothetical protein